MTFSGMFSGMRAQRAMMAITLAATAAMAAISPAAAQSATGPSISMDQPAPSVGIQADGVRTASAKVNGEILTGTDIDQRIAWLSASAQRALTPQERQQVIESMVDEMIQIQAARESEITISAEEVNQYYERYAQQELNMTKQQLDEAATSVGSSPASIKRMLMAQVAWQALLRRNIAPMVNVSQREVTDQIERMKADKGTNEYRLGEIYVAAPAGSEEQVNQTMMAIQKELQETGDFAGVAAKYSQATTAARGGDLGFVRLDRLPPALAAVVPGMEVGQLTNPVACCGGYSILYLRDKRQVMVADPRDGNFSGAQISIQVPQGLKLEDIYKFGADFGDKTQAFTGGCETVEADAKAIGATAEVFQDVPIRRLPTQLQEWVMAAPIGGVTQPYGLAASDSTQPLRAMMVCGRTDPPMLNGPTVDQVMSQIENERIDRRAQNYMRDLRRDAIIEYN